MNPGVFHDDDLLVFVGVRGLPSFNAQAAAKSFLDHQERYSRPPQKVSHASVEISPFGTNYNISSMEIARHLDHANAIEKMIQELASHIKKLDATVIALPPVMGIRNTKSNLERIESELGVRAFELLALPPSVPGYRLIHSLETQFLEGGGKILDNHIATTCQRNGQIIKSIIAKTPRREIKIESKAFFLASGKYIGGGIVPTETGLTESVFEISPVNKDFVEASFMRPEKATEINSTPQNGHDIFAAGLSVDHLLRPIDYSGSAAATNLFCAGAILAGYNYHSEKNGLGVALSTSYQSGKNAISFIKEVS
jgi:glycerol-3-phosphate dehydrogenase subunit B